MNPARAGLQALLDHYGDDPIDAIEASICWEKEQVLVLFIAGADETSHLQAILDLADRLASEGGPTAVGWAVYAAEARRQWDGMIGVDVTPEDLADQASRFLSEGSE